MEEPKTQNPAEAPKMPSMPTPPKANPPMKSKLEKYSKKNPWLIPAMIAFALGLGVAIAGNLLFSSQFETIGIVVGSVLSVFFLALLGLLFFVLHQIQQRARWEHDNFQLAIKAELEYKRSEQLAIQSRKRQEMEGLLSILAKAATPAKPDVPNHPEVLTLVQEAMNLAASTETSLADKLVALQSIISKIHNTLNPK